MKKEEILFLILFTVTWCLYVFQSSVTHFLEDNHIFFPFPLIILLLGLCCCCALIYNLVMSGSMKEIAYIILTALITSPYFLIPLVEPIHFLYLLVYTFLIISIIIFNCLIGRFAWSKPYFMSRYNILSAKIRHQQEFDIPMQLLFEKLMEAIPIMGLEILHRDEKNGKIFASTKSWKTIGENIYISLTEVNDKTTLDFCSVSIFSLWGSAHSEERNERHYKDLIQEIDKSLVI
jgi:hypothetical protein